MIINQVKFNLDYGHRITRDDIPIILAIPAYVSSLMVKCLFVFCFFFKIRFKNPIEYFETEYIEHV